MKKVNNLNLKKKRFRKFKKLKNTPKKGTTLLLRDIVIKCCR